MPTTILLGTFTAPNGTTIDGFPLDVAPAGSPEFAAWKPLSDPGIVNNNTFMLTPGQDYAFSEIYDEATPPRTPFITGFPFFVFMEGTNTETDYLPGGNYVDSGTFADGDSATQLTIATNGLATIYAQGESGGDGLPQFALGPGTHRLGLYIEATHSYSIANGVVMGEWGDIGMDPHHGTANIDIANSNDAAPTGAGPISAAKKSIKKFAVYKDLTLAEAIAMTATPAPTPPPPPPGPSMTTQLSIYNGALLHCGERFLSGLTENREPRRLLDQVWASNGVKVCLEEGQWTFAMRTIQIDYDSSIQPAYGYNRVFDKPIDWVNTSSICSDEYFRSPLTRYVDEAGYWYSDLDTMYVRYISDDPMYGMNIDKWPESFREFVEIHFASRIIKKLSNSEEAEKDMLAKRLMALKKAKNKSAMNEATSFPAQGAWSRSRNRFPTRRDGGRSSGDLIG